MMKTAVGRCYRNLSSVCFGWFLLVVSFGSLQGIVSSINHEDGLGFFSMACFYTGAIICPFAATVFRRWLIKPVLCALTLAQIPLVLSYAYPRLYTVLPTAFIGGVAQSVAFSLTGAYIVWVATNLSSIKGEGTNTYLSMVFGIYYMSVSFAPVIGGACSSFILSMGSDVDNTAIQNRTVLTSMFNVTNETMKCGPYFCPLENPTVSKLTISNTVRYSLLGFYTLCMVAATIVFTFGMEEKTNNPKHGSYSMSAVLLSTMEVVKQTQIRVLAPLVFYCGMQWAFAVGDIMKAFGGCVFGAEKVATFIATYHLSTCVSSAVSGLVEPKTGRKALFILGFCVHGSTCLLTYFWGRYDPYLAYLICVLWGIGSGIYLSQSHALVGELFPANVDSAMAVYLMFRSLGQIVGFGYAHFLCMNVKTYITGGMCLLATIGVVLGYKQSRNSDTDKT